MNEDIKRALLQAHNEHYGIADDITKLRNAVRWADGQNENFWLPVDESKRPSARQIIKAYELVGLESTVDSIEDALERFDREKYLDLCSALNREPVG